MPNFHGKLNDEWNSLMSKLARKGEDFKFIKYNRKGVESEPYCEEILPCNPYTIITLTVEPKFAIGDLVYALDGMANVIIGKISTDRDLTDLSILDEDDIDSISHFKIVVNDSANNEGMLINVEFGIPRKDVIGKIVHVAYAVV